MLDTIVNTVFNGLVMSTSCYAMYTINPVDHPFAFTACAVGFCHGCAGIFVGFCESPADTCVNHVHKVTTSCMEIMLVPLTNINLYLSSKQSNALALGHGLFIVPLAFDVCYKFCTNATDDSESTAVLKDLTILGNIVSLLFLAANENNLPAGIMAFSAFFAYYGSAILEKQLSGTGKNFALAGNSLFFALIPLAIAAGGELAS